MCTHTPTYTLYALRVDGLGAIRVSGNLSTVAGAMGLTGVLCVREGAV